MKLFFSPTSPYVRKVLVLAHEIELVERITVVPVNPFEQSEALVAANPLSKVPTLVLDDGLTLFDSRVICEYLDLRHDGTRFFPPAGASRWKALRTQALADGVIDSAVALRLESLRPEAQRSQPTEERLLGAIRRGTATLADELADLPAQPTIAHIATGCALAYLDLRVAHDPWRERHEGLARWFTAWAARPSMVATAHPRS